MKKQILSLAAAALMLGSIATGCSSSKTGGSTDSTTVKDTTKVVDTTKKTDTTKVVVDTTKKDTIKK